LDWIVRLSDAILSFSDWISLHDFTILLPFFYAFLSLGGFTRTLDALLNLPPAIMKAVDVPFTGFIIEPGCQTMYNNIQSFLLETKNDVPTNMVNAIRSNDESIYLKGIQALDEGRTRILHYSYIGSLLACPGSYVNQEFVEDLFRLMF
jgi:hypothetical protein